MDIDDTVCQPFNVERANDTDISQQKNSLRRGGGHRPWANCSEMVNMRHMQIEQVPGYGIPRTNFPQKEAKRWPWLKNAPQSPNEQCHIDLPGSLPWVWCSSYA